MKIEFSLVIFFFLIRTSHAQSESTIDSDYYLQIDLFTQKFIEQETMLWEKFTSCDSIKSNCSSSFFVYEIITHFKNFGDELHKILPKNRDSDILHQVPVWTVLRNVFESVDKIYADFRHLQLSDFPVLNFGSKQEMQDYLFAVKAFLSHYKLPVFTQAMERILNILWNSEELSDVQTMNDHFCTINQSPQQFFYNIYNLVASVNLKHYMLVQFKYMMHRILYRKTIIEDILRDDYIEKSKEIGEMFKSLTRNASREIWKCDPQEHVYNETYIVLTELLQGYVSNALDIDPIEECHECSQFTETKLYRCSIHNLCNHQRSCAETIRSCQPTKSVLNVCYSSSVERRYEYVNVTNSALLGRETSCSKMDILGREDQITPVISCDFCLCLCDEKGKHSDRYFNLRSAIANICENKVVTGLRFVKNKGVVHIQIQEGELLPRGHINSSSLMWVPIDDYDLYDKNIVEGLDYHTLTYNERAINLDEIHVEETYAITGIRFKKVDGHLSLDVHCTKFNFASGNLILPQKTNLWTKPLTIERSQLKLEDPDVPIYAKNSSEPDSNPNQYVLFTHSSFSKDFAQTTVPFLDAQPVISNSPMPLTGVAIYHKGSTGYGGFIALKVFTYNINNNFK